MDKRLAFSPCMIRLLLLEYTPDTRVLAILIMASRAAPAMPVAGICTDFGKNVYVRIMIIPMKPINPINKCKDVAIHGNS